MSMSMKTIMVDFDGVLHPTSASAEQLFCRLPLLEMALSGYECGIVISSSWRHQYDIAQLVQHFPVSLRGSVVGATGSPHIGKWPRYHEILDYCQRHGIQEWRALDDSFLEFPSPCKELILCNPNIGIAPPQVNALEQWLRQIRRVPAQA